MSAYVRLIYDRLDFLEFKQNILLLKQPQHKASIFCELSLDDFLKIRDLANDISQKIIDGSVFNIEDFENELFKVWPPIKSLPSASSLVAKSLMNKEVYESLFKYNN